MTVCIKCSSTKDLKLLNFFTFHRSYSFEESEGLSSPIEGRIPLERYKEFTRRDFLREMEKHFEEFSLEVLCGSCVDAFEWDFGRSWEQYTKEGLGLRRASTARHLNKDVNK